LTVATLAREVYRKTFYALAPAVLPDPSDITAWRATGTDTGALLLEVDYYESLDPIRVIRVKHYL
jgi:hypothetical protein